jgi:TRAP-type C4-dicarboxylate transport system substrate-binding protein
MHRFCVKTVLFLICILLSISTLGRAEIKPIQVAHVFPVSHSINLSLLHFQQKLNLEYAGRLRVEVIPEARLGQDESLFDQVVSSMLPMAVVNLKIAGRTAPGFSLFHLPFIFPDRRALYTLLDSPFKKQLISDDLNRKVEILGWFDLGPRVWLSSKKPFTKPADFRDAMINVPDDPLLLETVSVLNGKAGAIPTPGFGLMDGLTRGQFDMADVLLDEAAFAQGATLKTYLTLSYHVWEISVLVAGVTFWNSLTPLERQYMLNAAYEAVQVNRGYSLSQQVALLEKARSKGIEVIPLNEQDRRAFMQDVAPLYEKWRTAVGPAVFEEFTNRIREVQPLP